MSKQGDWLSQMMAHQLEGMLYSIENKKITYENILKMLH